MLRHWVDPQTGAIDEKYWQIFQEFDPNANYFTFLVNNDPQTIDEMSATQDDMIQGQHHQHQAQTKQRRLTPERHLLAHAHTVAGVRLLLCPELDALAGQYQQATSEEFAWRRQQAAHRVGGQVEAFKQRALERKAALEEKAAAIMEERAQLAEAEEKMRQVQVKYGMQAP